tara:strand:- start:806 stop:1408 length:603 start_codon:yes stop_codon:yes gene_type:complete
MEKRICIVGSSVSWGAWDYEKGGWVNRLMLHFNNLDIEDPPFVYNLSVDGETTKEILERFDVEIKARKPAIIIFDERGNDACYDTRKKRHLVSLENFEQNVIKLIKKSRKYTDVIIFCSCFYIDEDKTTPLSWNKNIYCKNEYQKQYDSKLKEITEREGVYFMPTELSKENLEDGLHPNTQGHEKIFLQVKDFLENKNLV